MEAPGCNGVGDYEERYVLIMGTGEHTGGKCGRGLLLITHPLLIPWVRKERGYLHIRENIRPQQEKPSNHSKRENTITI
jgi:hypothetical protein